MRHKTFIIASKTRYLGSKLWKLMVKKNNPASTGIIKCFVSNKQKVKSMKHGIRPAHVLKMHWSTAADKWKRKQQLDESDKQLNLNLRK